MSLPTTAVAFRSWLARAFQTIFIARGGLRALCERKHETKHENGYTLNCATIVTLGQGLEKQSAI